MTLENITGKGVDIPLLGIRKAMTALLEKGEIQKEDYNIFEVKFSSIGHINSCTLWLIGILQNIFNKIPGLSF